MTLERVNGLGVFFDITCGQKWFINIRVLDMMNNKYVKWGEMFDWY